MILCSVQHISKMYGGHKIFDDVSFEIHEGDRLGFVGRNGSGKTTVFKLLAGVDTPDEGQIHTKKGAKVGYLAQIPQFKEGTTGLDVLQSAYEELNQIAKRLKELEAAMSKGDTTNLEKQLHEYGKLQDVFTQSGGYEIEANIARVANGLHIKELLEKSFQQLSGGEQTKICLGFILLKEPDFLLLDEPTNHLDIGAVEWLEEFLKEYRGTVMIISHDRYFLDKVVTKIIDLEDGEAELYHTDYSMFVKQKEDKLLQEFQAYQEQQKKIKKMKEAIKRLKEWANQANPPNEGLHKRARNMERALERMVKIKRPILDRKKMGLEFEESNRSGNIVCSLKDVNHSFSGHSLFNEVNMLVRYKERVAIVGDNGTGKSTIIKMLLKQLEPRAGVVKIGSSVKIGYLSQHFTASNPEMRLIDAFREEVRVAEGEARHILAGFLFYGASVFRKVGQLSGGEKMRLRLAQLMHQDINLLLLDEPTNHLDIDSREVLEDALDGFNGTIVAVSHDRYFLNKLFEKTYWIHNRSLHFFDGNYTWAKEKLMELNPSQVVAKVKREGNKEKITPPKAITETLEEIEAELEKIEAEIFSIDEKLAAESDLDELQKWYERKKSKELERDERYRLLEDYI
ncbi:ribosomal protection-like ABC-F family protein [Rossellomorea sp. BNER]|uniref:ribosomal protection-like ABC-F family protein n=1 Tax=Rossellomorea sp. BNER TaxID=2962031 RepID=UPI003AF28D54|nr:ABC-F type ribosomal protection protein [Rossellomorea sp. BNER]